MFCHGNRRRPLGVTRPDRSHSRCCKTSDESEEPLSRKPEPLAKRPGYGYGNGELGAESGCVGLASVACPSGSPVAPQWPFLLPVFREAMPKTRKTPLSACLVRAMVAFKVDHPLPSLTYLANLASAPHNSSLNSRRLPVAPGNCPGILHLKP
jgi:hypothetical protein